MYTWPGKIHTGPGPSGKGTNRVPTLSVTFYLFLQKQIQPTVNIVHLGWWAQNIILSSLLFWKIWKKTTTVRDHRWLIVSANPLETAARRQEGKEGMGAGESPLFLSTFCGPALGRVSRLVLHFPTQRWLTTCPGSQATKKGTRT